MLIMNIQFISAQTSAERDRVLDDAATGGRGRLLDQSSLSEANNSSDMEKISEKFPQVKEAYQACFSNQPPNNQATKEDCIWQAIGPEVRDKVIKYLDEEKEDRSRVTS